MFNHNELPLSFSNLIFEQYLSFVKNELGLEAWNDLNKSLRADKRWQENPKLWHDASFHEYFLCFLSSRLPKIPNFAYHVAKAGFSEKRFQIFTSMAGLLISPKVLFEKLPKVVQRMNVYNSYEFITELDNLAISKGRLIQGYLNLERSVLNGHLCDACKGSIEGSLKYFGHKLISLTESKCVKKGSDRCEYHISWVKRSQVIWMFVFVACFSLFHIGFSFLRFDGFLYQILLSFAGSMVICLGSIYLRNRKRFSDLFDYQQSLLIDQFTISEQVESLNRKIIGYQDRIGEALQLASVGENSVRFLHEVSNVVQLLKHYSDELQSNVKMDCGKPEKIATYSQAIENATLKVEKLLRTYRGQISKTSSKNSNTSE